MTAKRHEGHRAEKLGFHVDEPTKALTERVAQLERRSLSTANLHRAARRLGLRQVLRAELRGLGTPLMAKAAGSPLRFAFCCFPPASPAYMLEAGKQTTTPKDLSKQLICWKKIGAGEGIRTLDPDLGNDFGRGQALAVARHGEFRADLARRWAMVRSAGKR